jgi:hypothetical protein
MTRKPTKIAVMTGVAPLALAGLLAVAAPTPVAAQAVNCAAEMQELEAATTALNGLRASAGELQNMRASLDAWPEGYNPQAKAALAQQIDQAARNAPQPEVVKAADQRVTAAQSKLDACRTRAQQQPAVQEPASGGCAGATGVPQAGAGGVPGQERAGGEPAVSPAPGAAPAPSPGAEMSPQPGPAAPPANAGAEPSPPADAGGHIGASRPPSPPPSDEGAGSYRPWSGGSMDHEPVPPPADIARDISGEWSTSDQKAYPLSKQLPVSVYRFPDGYWATDLSRHTEKGEIGQSPLIFDGANITAPAWNNKKGQLRDGGRTIVWFDGWFGRIGTVWTRWPSP